MLYMEELEADLETNFLPSRNPKPVTESEITEAQNQYSVVVSFNNNPHIDFDKLTKLRMGARNQPVINREAFNAYSLKIHNLPLEMMADSDEEFEADEQQGKRAKTEESDGEESEEKNEKKSDEGDEKKPDDKSEEESEKKSGKPEKKTGKKSGKPEKKSAKEKK
jgi:hypothetical protein